MDMKRIREFICESLFADPLCDFFNDDEAMEEDDADWEDSKNSEDTLEEIFSRFQDMIPKLFDVPSEAAIISMHRCSPAVLGDKERPAELDAAAMVEDLPAALMVATHTVMHEVRVFTNLVSMLVCVLKRSTMQSHTDMYFALLPSGDSSKSTACSQDFVSTAGSDLCIQFSLDPQAMRNAFKSKHGSRWMGFGSGVYRADGVGKYCAETRWIPR